MKKCCLLTYVHNEDFFFPIFLNYYTKIFDPEDIYVLNNNNADQSFYDMHKKFGFQLIDCQTQYNHDFLMIHREVDRQYQKLLKNYQGIFLLECDEILFHVEGLHNMVDAYMQIPSNAIRSIGYEPLHDYWAGEPAINTNDFLLMQRKYWWETPWYRKPVFIKQPIDYWHDMHRYAESYPFLDTKLTLIHLKYIDYEQLWRRNLKSVAEGNFSEHVIAENVSPHNRISDKNEFDKFFKSNFDKRVPIPRCFKEVC